MTTRSQTDSEYIGDTLRYFGTAMQRDLRNVKLCSVYPDGSDAFRRCHEALLEVEFDIIERLIKDLGERKVPGSFAEFGIYQGAWIDRLFRMTEKSGLSDRRIYGFDSFQGLSRPHEQFDVSYWQEGMYAASLAEVARRVDAAKRPRIHLIEGFFADSLPRADAQAVGDIAFARIDCDIYEPAKDCLRFLSKRLSHGAILVFDDWTHDYSVGEGRAFAEWVDTVPHLGFRVIFLGPWDHLHLRVLHRDKADVFASTDALQF